MYMNSLNCYEIQPLWYSKDRHGAEFSLAVLKDKVQIGSIVAGHRDQSGYIKQVTINEGYAHTNIASTLVNLCMGKLAHAGIPRDKVTISAELPV